MGNRRSVVPGFVALGLGRLLQAKKGPESIGEQDIFKNSRVDQRQAETYQLSLRCSEAFPLSHQ